MFCKNHCNICLARLAAPLRTPRRMLPPMAAPDVRSRSLSPPRQSPQRSRNRRRGCRSRTCPRWRRRASSKSRLWRTKGKPYSRIGGVLGTEMVATPVLCSSALGRILSAFFLGGGILRHGALHLHALMPNFPCCRMVSRRDARAKSAVRTKVGRAAKRRVGVMNSC